MARNGIPGFDEAVSRERRERNLAYLQLPYEICGIEILDITPRSYCKLVEAETPFFIGGHREMFHAGQFLFLCQPEVKFKSREAQQRHIRAIHATIAKVSLEEVCGEIEAFIDKTFLDSPTGGTASKAIASQMASLEYYFSNDPWRWDRERTLNMPLRIIYQQMRCHEKANGEVVINRLSDQKKAEFLAYVQSQLDAGKVSPEDLAKLNAKGRIS